MVRKNVPKVACTLAAAAMLALSAPGCGKGPTAPEPPRGRKVFQEPKGSVSQFHTRNVIYRVDEDIVAEMPNLNADVHVYEPNQPFIPANVDDFMVQIHTGDVIIDEKSMSALMNKYVFNYPDSPLSDIEIKAENGKIRKTGKMKKFGLTLSVELVGTLRPNGQGQLVLKPEVIKSNGIPVKGLFDLFGVELTRLINSNEDRGVKIEGNDVILYPDRMMPPPTLRGSVTGAVITPGKIRMTFDDGVRRDLPGPLPEPGARNFILMWGGNILINNNLALNAKFEMIDDTPEDPMYYYMPVYREQLEAGLTVATTQGEMIAYLRDVHGTRVEGPTRYRPRLPLVEPTGK